jgi:gluconokinase
MKDAIVFMGVAGCGKSSIARLVAQTEGSLFVEGDEFHSAASRAKMAQGMALTDDDRAEWLALLAGEICKHPQGLVLTCSALKKAYRDQLRQSAPSLKFVFLEIEKEEALRRVSARASGHFFPAALVDNQFATLESPVGEEGVLRLDATQQLETLQRQVADWLRTEN